MTPDNTHNASWTENSWGHPDKYHSVGAFDGQKKKSAAVLARVKEIETFLKARDPEISQKVERTFRQWNLIIRDYLRNETGLRLSVGDSTQSVPVRIVSGLPKPFEDLVTDNSANRLMILLNRPSIVNTAKGMAFFDEQFTTLFDEGFVDPDKITPTEIKRVREFVDSVARQTEKLALLDQIKSIEDDILGAYFFKIPVVHLYWMVIGTMAAMLDISVEFLTVVVAIHELAHAYSHLGKDIDGGKWETRSFAETDLKIAEGIAQFYTKIVCEKLSNRIPGALIAYTRLMELQSKPYLVHNHWIKDSNAAGEVIRASMIESRCRNITTYEDFGAILTKHRENIKPSNK